MDLRDEQSRPAAALPDTQAQREPHGITVHRAGVSGLKLPARITDVDGATCHTVATFALGVQVPAGQRGTHMSRLVEAGQDLARALHLGGLHAALLGLVDRLDAPAGEIAAAYPWFLDKRAPVSGRPSLLDVEVTLKASLQRGAAPQFEQSVRVPVTTLCPCSKAISQYGAHNQRSYVTVTLEPSRPVAVALVAEAGERHASCAVYGVLKRADEKFVTERAYENPKFAEDLVRDLYAELDRNAALGLRSVATENQESIHNHVAYATVVRA